MSQKELLPCPFCAGPARLVPGPDPYFSTRCQVECEHCRNATYWWDADVAVATWNKRTDPADRPPPSPDLPCLPHSSVQMAVPAAGIGLTHMYTAEELTAYAKRAWSLGRIHGQGDTVVSRDWSKSEQYPVDPSKWPT